MQISFRTNRNISRQHRAALAITIAIAGGMPALARAQRANLPVHGVVQHQQVLSGPLLTAFQRSLEVSVDGSTFGAQVTAPTAAPFATSAPGDMVTVPVTLRWQAVTIQSTTTSAGAATKVMGYAVFKARDAGVAWDSVAFAPANTISLRVPISPESNAIFRVAPVFKETAWLPTGGSPSGGPMGQTVSNWTADSTSAVRVITR